MLDEALDFLEKRSKLDFTYEVIVVSDGSTDKTIDVAQNYAEKFKSVRVLRLITNRGKGGAVRLVSFLRFFFFFRFYWFIINRYLSVFLRVCRAQEGVSFFLLMQMVQQNFVILKSWRKVCNKFLDVYFFFIYLIILHNGINSNYAKHDIILIEKIILGDYKSSPDKVADLQAVVCGSRAHLETEEIVERSFLRLFLMHSFHFLVWTLCVRGIRDTQCGFKLLTRASARSLFESLHVERWAFDVEMLYLAQTLNIPLTEIAVNWVEVEGSKIVPFWSWLQMGCDLGLIWLRYKIGAWKIVKFKKS